MKFKSDFINEWDSSSADCFLCWAAAEHTGMPGCGDRALMLCAADGAKGTLESQAETFCQIDKTALRRQFTAPTKI